MKDAKGHGSNPRGAHAEGTEQVGTGQPHIGIVRSVDANGKPMTGPYGWKWEAQHLERKLPVGDLGGFKSRKEGEAFLNAHLDPTNPKWTSDVQAMYPLYRKARAISLGIK